MSRSSTALQIQALAFVPLVKPNDVPTFVAKAEIVVLRVDYGTPMFDAVIRRYFETKYGGSSLLGRVRSESIDLHDPFVQLWIQPRNSELGLHPVDVVRNGYYLFVDGQIAGYHPALWDWKEDRSHLIVGFIALVAGMAFEDGEVASMANDAANFGAAQRVISFFEDQIQETRRERQRRTSQRQAERAKRRRERTQRKQRAIEGDEISRAYRFLGVASTCTTEELRAAYHELAKRHHPDRNPADFERSNGILRQINDAYALIKAHRERGSK